MKLITTTSSGSGGPMLEIIHYELDLSLVGCKRIAVDQLFVRASYFLCMEANFSHYYGRTSKELLIIVSSDLVSTSHNNYS